METSPQYPPKLAAAIVAVMASVKKLAKTERNAFAKYDFVSVDSFYEAVGPLMADNGLACLSDCISSEVVPGNVKYDNNGKERQGAPLLKETWAFTLIHSSGECAGPYRRAVTVPAEGAQAHGSSESYATKQFLRGTFKVPTGDKDDPDHQEAQTHGAKPAKPVQKVGPAKPHVVKLPGESPHSNEDVIAAIEKMGKFVGAAKSVDDVWQWFALNDDTVQLFKMIDEKRYNALIAFRNKKVEALENGQ